MAARHGWPGRLIGDETRNVRIPTGVGALRPTCLIPPSMEAGIPQAGARYAIVGLKRLKDFYPSLVAENLSRQTGPDGKAITARALSVDYVVRDGEIDSVGTVHARSLDHEENRARLAAQIRPLLQDGEIVGLPAVLGLEIRTRGVTWPTSSVTRSSRSRSSPRRFPACA